MKIATGKTIASRFNEPFASFPSSEIGIDSKINSKVPVKFMLFLLILYSKQHTFDKYRGIGGDTR